MDFSSTHWDLIRAGGYDDNIDPNTDKISPKLEETCKKIDSVAEDLKRRLREHPLDEQLFSGTNKFIHRYNCYLILQVKYHASFCSSQIWIEFWRVYYNTKVWKTTSWKTNHHSSHSCWQTQKGVKKGKTPVIPGRPAGSQSVNNTDKHSMHVCNDEPKGKRLHNLSANIAKGQQNGGTIFSLK